MKKILFVFIPLMILCACGGKKISPEEEVRNYGKYFVEKINANQLDSLKTTYPDIVKADSIVPVQSDTIIVVETSPGLFDVALVEGINLKLKHSEDGNISVVESRGLFTFPEGKIEIAKKTGMWNDSLTDASLAERMKDEDFFNHIKKNKTKDVSKIITYGNRGTVTKVPRDGLDSGKGYFILTNKSNHAIKGSDYNVIEKEIIDHMGRHSYTSTHKGVDIPANGTAHYNVTFSGHTIDLQIQNIKWNISESELISRFAPFTGKEYQEYLDSKK